MEEGGRDTEDNVGIEGDLSLLTVLSLNVAF